MTVMASLTVFSTASKRASPEGRCVRCHFMGAGPCPSDRSLKDKPSAAGCQSRPRECQGDVNITERPGPGFPSPTGEA